MSFDEQTVVTLVERVNLRELRFWVSEGWVRPSQSESGPIFDDVDIARIRLLCDLSKDMALATDVLPVVLSLIDRLNQTRRELRALTDALEKQPDDIRHTVIATLQELRNGASDAE